MKRYQTRDSLQAQLAGRWLSALGDIAPELKPAIQRPGRHVPCPVHGGKDGFRLFPDAPYTGGGVCNQCGVFASGFALLQWLMSQSYGTVLSSLNQWLHGVSPCGSAARFVQSSTPSPRPERLDSLKRMYELWHQALPLQAATARTARQYLSRRGLASLDVQRLPWLRYHPALRYTDGEGSRHQRFPALIARVADARGTLITLHRTYLTHRGEKAPVSTVRKLYALPSGVSLSGFAIRPDKPDKQVLHIAEGIETALSVQCATGHPVWSAINATLLARFKPPGTTRQVVIWADNDWSGTGQLAASQLAQRLESQGIIVDIRLPEGHPTPQEKSIDWNDVWIQDGAKGFGAY